MANKVKRLPLAEQDLDDIWLNVALDSPNAADRLLLKLLEAERMLGEHPLAGRSRDSLGIGLRSWPVGSYLVFYRVDPGVTVIVRVIWGGRNLPEIFKPPPA